MEKIKQGILNKWWHWVIIGIIFILLFNAVIVSDVQSCKVSESDYIAMCELYNMEAELVNDAMDYIDDFANPMDIKLTRQSTFNCYSLIK